VDLAGIVASVDPAPWARAQMAFTVAVHIILVPLGVSWAFMTLVANYRAIRKDDADALLLAKRWSKVMAVTFAVGAVTGTVLSFELGILWPTFMERFGAAFGIPFAFEGIFFFTEAIFIAIYIYGWDRLKPWAHFVSGIPIVLAGLGGTFAVVAANSWMNMPSGFTLDEQGNVATVDPMGVIFNEATPYEFTHMALAAYIVGGYLIASVYAYALLKGRRTRYNRVGFLIPFTVASILMPVQMFVGDWAARSVYEDQPVKFAAMELVYDTESDVPETLGGVMTEDGDVEYGVPIPDLASWLSGFSADTEIQGLTSVPPENRPTMREVNTVHLAWDVMVGLGTALFLLALWFGFVWWRRRDLPKTKWFYRAATVAGVAALAAMEAGWIVTEVGRQPWIVYNLMYVEDAATTNEGIWASFLIIVAVYTIVAAGTIFVLRTMRRRWREEDTADVRVPYGPGERHSKTADDVEVAT
jgi:cytochrome bd ubiquinol oxidase subunit I